MRIFFDTNVLVSAFTTRGLCADVFRTVLAEHDLVISEFVLVELERVLLERFDLPKRSVHAIVAFLRRYHVEPTPEDMPDLFIRDQDDVWVLASALAAGADVLVTGDQDLLSVKEQVDIVITDPRDFWNMLKEQRGR